MWVITIFLPPWIIMSGLASTKPHHFWMAFLTLFTEVIQWLCTACFFETGSIIHFSEIPWGENWVSSLLLAFWFFSERFLFLHLLSKTQQKMCWGKYCCRNIIASLLLPVVFHQEKNFWETPNYPLAWKVGARQKGQPREDNSIIQKIMLASYFQAGQGTRRNWTLG